MENERIYIPTRFDVELAGIWSSWTRQYGAQGLMIPKTEEELLEQFLNGHSRMVLVDGEPTAGAGISHIYEPMYVTNTVRRGFIVNPEIGRITVKELGSVVASPKPEHQRKGYASKAVKAVIQGTEYKPDERLVALTGFKNKESTSLFSNPTKINGRAISFHILPPSAKLDGTEYHVHDLSHLQPLRREVIPQRVILV